MKKFILIALSLTMTLLVLGGCNVKKNNNSQKPTTTTSTSSEWETTRVPI